MEKADVTANLGFERELSEVLQFWDADKAKALSDKLHEHECSGGDLSSTVERLWEKLTMKIEGVNSL